MEKEILSRINEKVSALQKELDELKALVSSLSEEAPAEEVSADPIDISFDDAPFEVPVELEPIEEAVPAEEVVAVELEDIPVSEVVAEPEPVAEPVVIAEPEPVAKPEPIAEPEPAPSEKPKPAAKAAVKAPVKGWRTDIPGSPVANIISGISLNDRVLFINTLFKEDPMLFQSTVSAFNSMHSLADAEKYIEEHFPDWNLNSDIVYRLMMAIRRKLK